MAPSTITRRNLKSVTFSLDFTIQRAAALIPNKPHEERDEQAQQHDHNDRHEDPTPAPMWFPS